MPASQQQIRERCRHPTGACEPFDGLRAELGSLTYHQLGAEARRVASAILGEDERGPTGPDGARPGSGAVAILSALDSHAIVAVLGALEAGRVFVVPDRSLSRAGQQRVIDDAGVDLILADAGHLGAARDLAGGGRRVLSPEDIGRAGGIEAVPCESEGNISTLPAPGPRHRDITAQTRTPAAPGARWHRKLSHRSTN